MKCYKQDCIYCLNAILSNYQNYINYATWNFSQWMVFFDFTRYSMWGHLTDKTDIKHGRDNYLSACLFKWKCNGSVSFRAKWRGLILVFLVTYSRLFLRLSGWKIKVTSLSQGYSSYCCNFRSRASWHTTAKIEHDVICRRCRSYLYPA